jgi:hypothetical protein
MNGAAVSRITTSPLDERFVSMAPDGTLYFARFEPAQASPRVVDIVRKRTSGDEETVDTQKVQDFGGLTAISANRFAVIVSQNVSATFKTDVLIIDTGTPQRQKTSVYTDILIRHLPTMFCAADNYSVGPTRLLKPKYALAVFSFSNCGTNRTVSTRNIVLINTGDAESSNDVIPLERSTLSYDGSPDGQWLILHVVFDDGISDGLWLRNIHDGEAIKVSDVGQAPAWRPVP